MSRILRPARRIKIFTMQPTKVKRALSTSLKRLLNTRIFRDYTLQNVLVSQRNSAKLLHAEDNNIIPEKTRASEKKVL